MLDLQLSRFLSLVPKFYIPLKKKNATFFVRPLGRTDRFQNIDDVDIMITAINSSINLYAQLAIVAENRPKQTSPSFSA